MLTAYIRDAEWPIFVITFWVIVVSVAPANIVHAYILGRRRGPHLQRVEFQFGLIFMTVRKMPKMNLELASHSLYLSLYDTSDFNSLTYHLH